MVTGPTPHTLAYTHMQGIVSNSTGHTHHLAHASSGISRHPSDYLKFPEAGITRAQWSARRSSTGITDAHWVTPAGRQREAQWPGTLVQWLINGLVGVAASAGHEIGGVLHAEGRVWVVRAALEHWNLVVLSPPPLPVQEAER